MHPTATQRRDHLAALVRASATLAALPPETAQEEIVATLYRLVSELLDIRDFVVARYDAHAGLLRCASLVADGITRDPCQLPPLPLGHGPASTVVRTGYPVIIGDIRAGRTDWINQEVGEGDPVRSVLMVPMTRGGAVTGVVQAQSPRIDAFSPEDAAALSILANQAAAAIEAARHQREAAAIALRARVRDEIGRLVSASLDLKEVLAALAEQVASVIGGGCAVYLLTPDGRTYEDRLLRYRDTRLAALERGIFARRPRCLSETFIGRIVVRGEPVYIGDIATSGLEPELTQGALALGIRQALFAPIQRDGQVLGAVMALGTDRYPLDQEELALTIAVGSRAAAAIERAGLYARVEQQAADLAAVIAGMVEGVLVVGADGRVRLLNDAGRRILGERAFRTSRLAWIGVSALRVRLPGGTPVTRKQAKRLLLPSRPYTDVEVVARGPDGADRLLRVNAAPLAGGSVLVFEDITGRRAVENAREEFLAQASHELRTPLTSLLGYLQMAERRVQREGAPPAVGEAVSGAVGQAQRLRGLVTDLLEAIRIRQGRLPLHPVYMDLVALVCQVVAEREERESGGGHSLVLDVRDQPLTGVWDEQRLRQVAVHLLDNAIKYTPGGGSIRLTLAREDHSALFAVQDSGIGIPLSEQEKLFRPFGRAEHLAAQNIPGFGMGLYICRDIVERHGGMLTLHSQPGIGSTFIVRLPLASGPEQESQA